MDDMEAVILRFTFMAIAFRSAMGFRPPTKRECRRAIGNTEGLPITMQRALNPLTDFDPILPPNPGDWLAEHYESGQTFKDFIRTGGNKPDSLRNSIYLQPLGRFQEDGSPPLDTLRSCALSYFALPVKILPPLDISRSKFTSRINPYSGNWQILTRDVLMFLRAGFPSDAFCILAITMEDLYPDPSWNFVFGQASLKERVGVFSFARYNPAFYGDKPREGYRDLLLRRSCNVLIHETAHMIALEHCIFFRCIMNGSNHLNESDSRPMFFCPVCLRKLQNSTGFDVVDRYRNLLLFYERIGLNDEVRWLSNRLIWISDAVHGK
jgi:archaemetzincin